MEPKATFYPVGWRLRQQREAPPPPDIRPGLPQLAWITHEYVTGRTQKQIADELGIGPSAISLCVKRFCEYFGYDVSRMMMYGLFRQEASRSALAKYGGELIRPSRRVSGRWWGDETPFTVSELAAARGEHAWLLRAEGLKLRKIGQRLGVSGSRAKQIVDKHGRRVARAVQHICWPKED